MFSEANVVAAAQKARAAMAQLRAAEEVRDRAKKALADSEEVASERFKDVAAARRELNELLTANDAPPVIGE